MGANKSYYYYVVPIPIEFPFGTTTIYVVERRVGKGRVCAGSKRNIYDFALNY